jgi:hypothetical protein
VALSGPARLAGSALAIYGAGWNPKPEQKSMTATNALADVVLASMLACWSGVAFGEIDCNKRCGTDYKSGCYDRCRADRGAEQKESLRQIDPKLAAAVEKRFPKIDEIEFFIGDPDSVTVYTPDTIWGCNVTRRPLRLHCRTRHQ